MRSEIEQEYLASRVLAADPLELVRILYETGLEAISAARQSLRDGDVGARSRAISRAHSALTELAMAVDREKGGTLGGDLVELYDYMQRRLIEANTRQLDAPLAEVARLLTTLLEGWRQCGLPPPSAERTSREWTA